MNTVSTARWQYYVRVAYRSGETRQRRYVGEACGGRGFWIVGKFETKRAAREATRAFLDTQPEEPLEGTKKEELPANWRWYRKWVVDPMERSPYVRKRGPAWQARYWLGVKGNSLNLGYFSEARYGEGAEWMASQVGKAFDREWRKGGTVIEVVMWLKGAERECERVPECVQVPKRQRGLTFRSNRRCGHAGRF
jgi:hypothetical protein